ncbi:MAG TPA: Spx/MgsR family RNA polymerase-binding regulatory protein [Oculatellaceae cyanobacterium]|jgi:regulatory protein spx
MSSLKFYGKASCITCKKAKAFLQEQGIAFDEFPIETQPPAKEILERLIDANGVKNCLNSRSAIYKEKGLGKNLPDKKTAVQLMQQDPNLIKRPVIINQATQLYQGFDEASLSAFLKAH